MFERFSELAIKAIMLAHEEALRQQNNYIGTEQMLLGLRGLEVGVASRALDRVSVTLVALREEVSKCVPDGDDIAVDENPEGPSFTPRAKRALELCWDEARLLEHEYIGDGHILLGIIREGDGIGVKALKKLGVDTSELRGYVLEELARV